MHRSVESWRGESPRLTPRALPANQAQAAVNARLLTGDLDAWRQFVAAKQLATPPTVETIFLLNGFWLSWNADVDVARGAVAGDQTFRTYLTGPSIYAEPRFTNLDLATTGAEPFPARTRPLGVPGPEVAPTTQVGKDTTATTFSVDVSDGGDQLATGWIKSPFVPFSD